MTILAIETSCDETSVAILKDNQILSNIISSQINLHQKYGGVVPELAARAHSDNISYVLSSAIKDAKINLAEIDYVAYTSTPGLVSCCMLGVVVADTIATYLAKPLVLCNHLYGHVYASLIDHQWEFPVLSLLVSGGHTQLFYLKEHLKFEILGQTLDDAVGECYDKVARMLGLSYPGGPEIDRLAKEGQDTYQLPLPKNDQTLDFSFSGLKSAAAKVISQEKENLNVANFCSSFQNTVVKILIKKITLAIEKYQVKTVVLAGGVSANSSLRASFLNLKQKYPNLNFIVPKLEYSTDNAAMIAILASYQIKQEKERGLAMVLGIVGEAGSGKTTAASFFQSQGAYLISADLIIKYIYQLPETKEKIFQKFGEEFLNPDETINRLALRKYAFENYQVLTKLEEITWPKMKEIIIEEISAHKAEQLIVLDCAVLFAANLDYLTDKVLLIEADESFKINRIKTRDGVSDSEAKTLLELQKEHLILDKRSDFIIKNDAGTEEFVSQLKICDQN